MILKRYLPEGEPVPPASVNDLFGDLTGAGDVEIQGIVLFDRDVPPGTTATLPDGRTVPVYNHLEVVIHLPESQEPT